ncbi:MAG: hypothetical protein IRZ09_12875 [Variibacter sp.]|nr:hypothetical protein [Variibacter sp.]
MRKSLMIAAAGLALALGAPLTASAAPAIPADAIKAAAERVSPVDAAAWHCRPWSAWCRGHWRGSSRGYWHRRWRSRRWWR